MADEVLAKAKESTSPGVLEIVKAPDFLRKCLRHAKLDHDLIQDVLDACSLSDLDALVLGSGVLAPDDIASQLFLMKDEAVLVATVCGTQCRCWGGRPSARGLMRVHDLFATVAG